MTPELEREIDEIIAAVVEAVAEADRLIGLGELLEDLEEGE